MRATNTFHALSLAALFALTGCVSTHAVYDDSDWGPAPYGHHYHHHGVDLVWQPYYGFYSVAGFPSLYWHDGWYWRHAGGHWERCDRPRGGHWKRVDGHQVPQRLHRRHASHGRDWQRHDDERREPRGRGDERMDRRHEWRERAQVRETPAPRDARPQRHEARRREEPRRERVVERRPELRRERPEPREERVEQRPDRREERIERGPEPREERAPRERLTSQRERRETAREALREEPSEPRDEPRERPQRRGRGGDYAQGSER